MPFADTELILNAQQRVYHLNLKAEDIADQVIVMGDPNRVAEISKRFDRIDFKTANREFVTHTGSIGNTRITALSTGIGTDNMDIVLNELDAAVNIDPLTRQLRPDLRRLNIYRLGTSGSLQEQITVNSLVLSEYAVGLDGLLNFYTGWQTFNEDALSEAFMKHTSWPDNLAYPYCVKASERLLDYFSDPVFIKGITVTAPGFYGPQGREIRMKPAMTDLNNLLNSFSHHNRQITNFEMETSALYGLGKLLGHSCLTICVIIANRMRKEFSKDYTRSTDILIDHCLHKIKDT